MARRCRQRHQAGPITDRAYRYRAASRPPPGKRICAFCGNRMHVEIGHVDGHEEDNRRANLVWTCRRCNVLCGNALRRAGLGRRTRQFNPRSEGAKSLGQWLTAVSAMKGESAAMDVSAAVDMIRMTPPERRSEFAEEIWRRRREHFGPTGRSDSVPF